MVAHRRPTRGIDVFLSSLGTSSQGLPVRSFYLRDKADSNCTTQRRDAVKPSTAGLPCSSTCRRRHVCLDSRLWGRFSCRRSCISATASSGSCMHQRGVDSQGRTKHLNYAPGIAPGIARLLLQRPSGEGCMYYRAPYMSLRTCALGCSLLREAGCPKCILCAVCGTRQTTRRPRFNVLSEKGRLDAAQRVGTYLR